MQDYLDLVKQYKQLFMRTNVLNLALMYETGNNFYDALYRQYDVYVEQRNVKQQARICQLLDEEVLPKLNKALNECKKAKLANNIYDLFVKCFALSARRNLKNFALYIEFTKKKKVWDKTMETVEPVFYYASEFINTDTLNLMRVSCMPGLGKSYIGNLIVANMCGNDQNISILRITYSDDLVKITTNQTKEIMRSEAFKEIFPRYAGVDEIFKSNTNDSFALIDCEDATNYFSVTREGQSTGKRAKVVVIDDVLKGELESYDITLHQRLVNRYDSDWSSRADDDKQKTLLLGTMWANTDLLNVLYDRATESEKMADCTRFKHVIKSEDGTSVFIGIPALDEFDESTCPRRFNTKFLLKKRSQMSEYLWRAVYMQNPIAPEGIEFSWEVLDTYDELPKSNVVSVYASLDPARRGKNYVSMPIVYEYENEAKRYLVDFLYRKKSMKELYDAIVQKIVDHRINRLVVENNTDTSLKEVLEQKLKERGYYGCTITEKYSTQNKEQRIKDHQGTARGEIRYPKKSLHSPNSDIGMAMDAITSYSFNYPNKFDDAIDSIVLLIMEFLSGRITFAKPKPYSIFGKRR